MSKTASSGRFSELLAAAVAGGASVKSAAETCGCSERQGYRISSTPEFKRRVCELRSSAVDSAVGEITSAAVLAVRKLVELLDDPHSALGAARAILANVTKLAETVEFRERLDKLERGE